MTMSDTDDEFVKAHRQFFWYKQYGVWTRARIEVGAEGPFFRRKRPPWPSYEQAVALTKMMKCCYRLTDDAAYDPNQEMDLDE
jgi:hypothetical protein